MPVQCGEGNELGFTNQTVDRFERLYRRFHAFHDEGHL